MSDGFDVERLRRILESRLQFALINQQETVDGGIFGTLRPASMEQGNGFAILLARTHRQFEASFRADNFAGALLRAMSEAGSSERKSLSLARQAAEAAGAQIYIAINGNAAPDCIDLKDRWSSLEIDVSKRFSSTRSSEDLMETALQVSSTCLRLVLALIGTDEGSLLPSDSSAKGLPEGAKHRVEVNRYERSPVNRGACIEHYGLKCQCCEFDFLEFYGELGEGYIEVHHCTPVSRIGTDYVVDPVQDLVPLCSNCHSMVHRRDPPLSAGELRAWIAARRGLSKTG
jgi:5-methylcytosine-specific restriction enzyme A